jgi:hypothetical protein
MESTNRKLVMTNIKSGEKIEMTRPQTVDRDFEGNKDAIVREVCKFFSINDERDILLPDRRPRFVDARTIISILLNEQGVHIDVIANIVGKNRASIYYMLEKGTVMSEYNKQLFTSYNYIKSML